eukprot:gene6928-7146_t
MEHMGSGPNLTATITTLPKPPGGQVQPDGLPDGLIGAAQPGKLAATAEVPEPATPDAQNKLLVSILIEVLTVTLAH